MDAATELGDMDEEEMLKRAIAISLEVEQEKSENIFPNGEFPKITTDQKRYVYPFSKLV